MSLRLRLLSKAALESLRDGLLDGRLRPPFSLASLHAVVGVESLALACDALNAWALDGMQPRHMGQALALLVAEREETQATADRIQLVWSPPELDWVDSRDTAVVVQELFRESTQRVDIVTYAIDQGGKAKTIFGELAAKMDADPALAVRLFINIPRPYQGEAPESTLKREFAAKFRDKIWPGARLPAVFYDPRSLKPSGKESASLHAKIVISDQRKCLITSANFTEAAQARNMEAGVLIEDATLALKIAHQLSLLLEKQHVSPLIF